jgi:hypothetical protein
VHVGLSFSFFFFFFSFFEKRVAAALSAAVCCRMQWTHITENLMESMKVYLKRRRSDAAP